MTTATAPLAASRRAGAPRLKQLAPVLVAAVFAIAYVIVSPASLDLADHLFRAQLFADEGFGLWNNLWYSGHHIVGYSVLFPAVSALLSPQLAGALAAIGTAALFELLARRHFGADAWLGAVLFGAATAIDLYTGRLAFAFGALPALGAVVALDLGRSARACGLAVLSALCSPVAALFAAVIAGGYALGGLLRTRRAVAALPSTTVAAAALPSTTVAAAALPSTTVAALPGVAVAVSALLPVALLAVAFPEGGSEPFGFATMFPVLVLAALALATAPREAVTLRAGIAVYAVATIVVYLIPSPIGSNIARLGTFAAAPLAALLWSRRHPRLLAVAALPLLYVGWAAPVRDVVSASKDQSATTGYYQPVLRFLRREAAASGQPFRTEIPFTRFHWEAWVVAAHFPLARGWERQLDIADNPLFYRGKLTAAAYERWLHANAVRFVAAPDAPLDYSAQREMALIDRGLPFLDLVMRSRHWRVYEVDHATPIASGAATLTGLGPDWLTLRARGAGEVRLRVRFTPYWALAGGAGCVARDGRWTRLTLRRAGPVKLVTRFSMDRIRASSPRCTYSSTPN